MQTVRNPVASLKPGFSPVLRRCGPPATLRIREPKALFLRFPIYEEGLTDASH